MTNEAQFLVPPEWTKDNENASQFNFGAIIIPNLQATEASFIKLRPTNKVDYKGKLFRISSYPRDPPDGVGFPEIWEATGGVLLADERRLNYQIDTGDASSGAPIWRYESGLGPVAVGIHTSSGRGRGIRFTKENLARLRNGRKVPKSSVSNSYR